ncbi:hypothetical protein OCOJLMKI_0367 [Methylobacterium iners]|uniref:DUF695 domain-containing protein n=2 Tax=Methylobacterium iners TaxID=418707 RepID=A0ABQ4RU97_9HYPH|nr:hypothetical protein OCOJLMKI_0367 [Methylobacterium iners]
MSSEEEFKDLIALENHLIVRPHADEAIYVGRLTARGSRVFYFYTADPGSLARDVKAAMEQHPAYQYQINSHADPEWSAYLRSTIATTAGRNAGAGSACLLRLLLSV